MLHEILLLSIAVIWNCEDGTLRQRFRTVESSGLWDCQRICLERPECSLLGYIENEAGRICAVTTGGGMIEATQIRMTICTKDMEPVVVHHNPEIVNPEMPVIPVIDPVVVEPERRPDPEPERPHEQRPEVIVDPVVEVPPTPVPVLPEVVFDKSEEGEPTSKPVEEVSIPIETAGVDIIRWCSSDPECRTFGDANAVCTEFRCVCSHGYESKSGFGICQGVRETLNPLHVIPTLVTVSFHFVDTKKLSLQQKTVERMLLAVIKNIYPSAEITSTASVVIGSTVAQFIYEMPLRVLDFVKIRTIPLRVTQSVESTPYSRTLGTHVAKSVTGIIKVNHLGVQATDCLSKGASKTFLAASDDESIEPQCVALECQTGMFLFYDPVANASRCAPEFETRHRQEGLCLYDAECIPPKVCKSGMCLRPSRGEDAPEEFHFHAIFVFTLTTVFIVGGLVYRRFLSQRNAGRSSPRWRQDLLGRY